MRPGVTYKGKEKEKERGKMKIETESESQGKKKRNKGKEKAKCKEWSYDNPYEVVSVFVGVLVISTERVSNSLGNISVELSFSTTGAFEIAIES